MVRVEYCLECGVKLEEWNTSGYCMNCEWAR